MKTISLSIFVWICMVFSGFCQVPEIVLNDLLISNAYKTYASIDSVYYFQGHNGDNDWELWRSNGTPEGTYRVANIHPEEAAWTGELTAVGDQLYFIAANQDAPEQLYKSDGTEEGTHWVFDVDPEQKEQYHMLTASGGLLYFRTNRPSIGSELWVSDGTTDNTHMVADICENMSSSPHELTDFNGSLVFIAVDCQTGHTTLYQTSGLNGIVTQLGGDLVSGLMSTGDRLFFKSSFGDYGSELGTSAGVVADVTRVSDIYPGEYGSDIYHITKVNSMLFFRAYEADNETELWSYDLTAASIQMVKDINPGASNGSFPSQLIAFKGKLFFSARDGVHGEELWISDGTDEGTYMLKNIREGDGDIIHHSYPQKFFATEDLLFFQADDGIHGPELWQTDGTAEGTKMTADIWPKSSEGSDPGGFAEVGDYLVFNAWSNKRTLFRLKIHNTSTVGIEEHLSETSMFYLYPNPAYSNITIESHSKPGFQYQILDITGREIMNGIVPDENSTQLDLSILRPGLYLFRGEAGQGHQTMKFILR